MQSCANLLVFGRLFFIYAWNNSCIHRLVGSSGWMKGISLSMVYALWVVYEFWLWDLRAKFRDKFCKGIPGVKIYFFVNGVFEVRTNIIQG